MIDFISGCNSLEFEDYIWKHDKTHASYLKAVFFSGIVCNSISGGSNF